MSKIESTNAELIAAVRDWDGPLPGGSVHPIMRKLADRLEAAEAAHSALQRSYNTVDQQGRALVHENTRIEAELTRRDTVIGHDELSTLCLSYLRPPKFSGSSWTLNPDALATAILERLAAAHPYNPEPTDVEAER